MKPLPIQVRTWGRDASYESIWQAMQRFTDKRNEDTLDELWLVEHNPVFTLGQAAKPDHLLAPGDIPVVQIDRGGQVTYHGPGQLVAYPLLDLRRRGIGIRTLVDNLEQSIINTLAGYGIQGERRDGAPGVFVAGSKIAALGLRVRRGCTFHGLALNVAMDLEPYARINPCGFPGLAMTQISTLGGPAEWKKVAMDLTLNLCEVLGYRVYEKERASA